MARRYALAKAASGGLNVALGGRVMRVSSEPVTPAFGAGVVRAVLAVRRVLPATKAPAMKFFDVSHRKRSFAADLWEL